MSSICLSILYNFSCLLYTCTFTFISRGSLNDLLLSVGVRCRPYGFNLILTEFASVNYFSKWPFYALFMSYFLFCSLLLLFSIVSFWWKTSGAPVEKTIRPISDERYRLIYGNINMHDILIQHVFC